MHYLRQMGFMINDDSLPYRERPSRLSMRERPRRRTAGIVRKSFYRSPRFVTRRYSTFWAIFIQRMALFTGANVSVRGRF